MNNNNSNNLKRVEANLPPGFRFHPRDEELICDYLMNKIGGGGGNFSSTNNPEMIVVDLNKCEPWDIPETACVGGKDWYFYSQRDRKYASGLRRNRATVCGYWKATGKDKEVYSALRRRRRRKSDEEEIVVVVGMRKTLVFYKGRAPKGNKTDWVMHEFRLHPSSSKDHEEDWVVCRVFHKKKLLEQEEEDHEAIYKRSVSCSHPHPHPHPHHYYLSSNTKTMDQKQQHQHDSDPLLMYNFQAQAQANQEQELLQVPCFSISNAAATTTFTGDGYGGGGGGGPMNINYYNDNIINPHDHNHDDDDDDDEMMNSFFNTNIHDLPTIWNY